MTPHDLVDERFRIERLVGAGGMGAVYRARDLRTDAPVAIKVLLGTPKEDDMLRFEREARTLAEINHPGIVRYIAHGLSDDGRPFLAMEWVEGQSLADRLDRERLSVSETITLGVRLSEALGAVHLRGVVHRDLKPSNILLERGALDRTKIVDFGLAMLPQAPRATATGEIIGTPEYMAPEQARGSHDIDSRCDVFALGSVLYECIAGEAAFKADHVMAVLVKIILYEIPHLRDLGHQVPAAFDGLIARMLAKDPSMRPEHGGAVAAVLRELDPASGVQITSPSQCARPGLTGAEQRLVSVVLARVRQGPEARSPQQTLASAGASTLDAALAAIAEHGGRPALLADGTLAVTVSGAGMAKDHAALAAECALMLRDRRPGREVGICRRRHPGAVEPFPHFSVPIPLTIDPYGALIPFWRDSLHARGGRRVGHLDQRVLRHGARRRLG